MTRAASDKTVECPFCREEVNAAAIKCEHCGSALAQQGHGGICPL